MSLIPKLSILDKAILVSTGNSLVLCGSATEIEINTSDMMTLSGETTRQWEDCGSSANINIIENSEVLYAELIWYSTVKSNVAGSLDVRSVEDEEIIFELPNGKKEKITPDYGESFTSKMGNIDRFRSKNVTDMIFSGGTYSVSKVPTSIPKEGLSSTRAGWSLIVVYKNDSFYPQKIMLSTGINVITSNPSIQSTVTGFTTSEDINLLSGKAFFVCANGEPLDGNQTVKFGHSFANLTNVGNLASTSSNNPSTSPNNPNDRFFAGQINMCDPLNENYGLININGTNAVKNHDAFTLNQVVGARNKWDMTMVDISKSLVQGQSLLASEIKENLDSKETILLAMGIQVNALAPDITAILSSFDPDGNDEVNREIGEQNIYSLQINNNGQLKADNVILSMDIGKNCSFISNSFKINDVIKTGVNIINGVNIGSIEPNAILNVTFAVRIDSLPSENHKIMPRVNYSYQFLSGIDTITNSSSTNQLTVIIQSGQLNATLNTSKTTAKLLDIVDYTVDITNNGTETAKNIFFQDKINKYCSFVSNSVKINGILKTGFDPCDGFDLDDLDVSKTCKVEFSVKIEYLPPSTFIDNNACITFSYQFNQYLHLIEKTIFTNNTSIQIEYIDIIGQRSVDNNYPKVKDVVNYSLSLTNVGNIPTKNFEVLEPEIKGAIFVEDSVKIDGKLIKDINPFDGFTLPNDINPKQSIAINYKMQINEIQQSDIIQNIANIPFKYQITTQGAVISQQRDSNVVTTRANYICMNINETVDKSYATTDDILYYKIIIQNNGNIDAVNTMFLSSIQPDAVFIDSSVTINGMPYNSYNPSIGFDIGNVKAGNLVEIMFKAKIKEIPNPNIIYNQSNLVFNYKPDPHSNYISSTIFSNIVQTLVNKANYVVTKTVDKSYAQLLDYLVYTTTIQNTGTVVLSNIKFVDNTPRYLDFYPETIYINGKNYPEYNPNDGFLLDDIHPGDTATVIFGTVVKSIPSFGYILNTSQVDLSYKTNQDSPNIATSVYSNEVQTFIVSGDLKIIKSVNKAYATIDDTIKYSFNISNVGNVTLTNVHFYDLIQNEATFIDKSLIVNGVYKEEYNPNIGFDIGTLYVGQVVTLSFDAKVISIPNPNILLNSASSYYSYKLNPSDMPITKNKTSNDVITIINKSISNLVKLVDKNYATLNDTITYTITAYNMGTVNLTNVFIKDMIQDEIEFEIDSVYVDGVNKIGFNPNEGFYIDDILPNGNSVISFTTKVISIPPTSEIKNIATMEYKYRLNPLEGEYIDKQTSNEVTTNINAMNVANTKSVNKNYATIGNTLTYTSVISNHGNVDLINTNFVDVVDATFIPKTVKINGDAYEDYNPNEGFTLGTISPNSYVTITFDVKIEQYPLNGYITNSSSLYYEYKINPDLNAISANINSNDVNTYVNVGNMNIVKNVDRSVAIINDIIKYSFVISNIGNTNLSNISFKDIIQEESTFNKGSVYINGINKPNYNPNIGFAIDDLNVGEYTSISFSTTINSIPLIDGKVYNSASINYFYKINPNDDLIPKTTTSNTTIVDISQAIISPTKSVDKNTSKIGDSLNFTINLTNSGNVSAKRVFFEDLLDTNISFDEDSVYINGVNYKNYNPNEGFNVLDISAGATTTITFSATVKSRPDKNIIYNFATIEYEYKVDTQTINVTTTTNTTQTYVSYGMVSITKSANKEYATIGDDITYSVIIKNTGSVSVTNLKFKDIVDISASFKTASVIVNGLNKTIFDPNIGFNLADLSPNQSHTIVFSVKVNSLPLNQKIDNTANITFSYKITPSDIVTTVTNNSNKVTTFINLGKLMITKSVDKMYATINDILNYSISIKNVGDVNCTNVYFIDEIQSNATFVPLSVTINSNPKSSYNPNTGFNLNNIAPNETVVVAFSVKVNTLPTNYLLINKALVNYKYYINPNLIPISTFSQSNIVTTHINVASLTCSKAVNKAYATVGDTVSYTVNILNSGNINISNINFRDVIPNGLIFTPNSVKINGISQRGIDPYQSFSIGSLIPGNSVKVEFDTTVIAFTNPSLITNKATLIGAYRINPLGDDCFLELDTNIVTTQVNVGSLSLDKRVDKSYGTKGDVLNYTIILTNNGNVPLDNVTFLDNLQTDVIFNIGTVKINDEIKSNLNPNMGFNVGTINTLSLVKISFDVTIIQNPTHNSILNYSIGTFSYKIDPHGNYYTKSSKSNTVSTIIVIPSLTGSKTVSHHYATLNDTLNYSILFKNDGNTLLSNLKFKDILSEGATFVNESIYINGTNYPNYNIAQGFDLPNLVAGNSVNIKFDVKVSALPLNNIIANFGYCKATYKVDPLGSDMTISTNTNTVTTNINVGNLSNVKSVNKEYAKIDDALTYTCVVTNIGNVVATNIKFFDTLQNELKFISGTVKIDDVLYASLDPIVGFSLPDLEPNQKLVVMFDAKIKELPTPAQVSNKFLTSFNYKIDPNGVVLSKSIQSNIITTMLVKGEITSVKTVDKPIATIGDTLTYNVNLVNIGNVVAKEVFFQDIIPSGAVFKIGSVSINGLSKTLFNPNDGFVLDDIGVGDVAIISFICDVISVPETNIATNQASTTFKFIVDPKHQPYTQTTYSNPVTTNIVLGNLSVNKVVDKEYATIGDILTYTITIVNSGNINATNVVFIDQTPQNSVFVSGSVVINGTNYSNYNPSAGFTLNTIIPGQIITVVYKVQVLDLC